MALFDKLKEKVNKVVESVDVDKLSEMASKAVESVKNEVVKAVDPTVKEQERQAKEQALQEEREQKRREQEKIINDFFVSINLDEEFEYIFSVLEKSGATSINFEKGVEHMLSKTETTISKEAILPTLKKELVARAFADTGCVVAAKVVIDYFMRAVINDKLINLYMRFTVFRESNYSMVSEQEPFIKALYGIVGRAVNYLNNRSEQGNYRAIAPLDFNSIIENSDVLKSYTDVDPFAADKVRMKWGEDLCNSPLELVKECRMSSFLDKEEYVDAICYYTYIAMYRGEENPTENIGVSKIAETYLNYLKEYYNKIRQHH